MTLATSFSAVLGPVRDPHRGDCPARPSGSLCFRPVFVCREQCQECCSLALRGARCVAAVNEDCLTPWASRGDCLDPAVSTYSERTSQVAFTPALLGRIPGSGHVHEKVSLTWGRGREVALWRSKIKASSQDLQAERADGPAWLRLSRESLPPRSESGMVGGYCFVLFS